MYEDYYRFVRRPFSLTPDPEFLYRSTSHQAALEQLLRAIRRREGFIVLTGDIGTGKTTLYRAVVEQLGPKTFSAVVLNPFLSEDELLRVILQDFGVVSRAQIRAGRLAGASKQDLVETLNDFLLSLVRLGASALVVIDEAQNLAPRVLEQVRVLTNLETDREKLLQILLVGQLNLQPLLHSPEMRQLEQRISRRCTLGPLSRVEVDAYVAHRLAVARRSATVGRRPPVLPVLDPQGVVDHPADGVSQFTGKALDMIHRFSGGIPRTINLLCDRALEKGCEAQIPTITHEIVREAARSLALYAIPSPPPKRHERRMSAMTLRWVTVAAGAAAGVGIAAAAVYQLMPSVDPRGPAPPPPASMASLALPLPLPVEFVPEIPESGPSAARGEPTSARGASFSIQVATFPEPAAAAAAAAILRELGYRAFEVAADGAQEYRVLIGRYADLDEARQDEAQLKTRWQFTEARIVAELEPSP